LITKILNELLEVEDVCARQTFTELFVLNKAKQYREVNIEVLISSLVDDIREIRKSAPEFNMSEWAQGKTLIEIIDDLIVYGILDGPDINPNEEENNLDEPVRITKLTEGYYNHLLTELSEYSLEEIR